MSRFFSLPYQFTAMHPKHRSPNHMSIWGMRLILGLGSLSLSQCTLEGTEKVIILREGEVAAQAGDTAYSIAHAHGVPVKELIALNGLTPPYTFTSAQKLILPSSGQEERTADGQSHARPLAQGETTGPKLIQPEDAIEWMDYTEDASFQGKKDFDRAKTGPKTKNKSPIGQADLLSEGQWSDDQDIFGQNDNKKEGIAPSGAPEKAIGRPVNRKISKAYNPKKRCFGVFFQAGPKTAVKAIADGVVLCAGVMTTPDQPMVLIQHKEQKILSAYLPLTTKKILVKAQQKVKKGQILGYIDGDELYLEIRNEKRETVDPMLYIPQ